jgi:phosphoribosylformimino-5-aminoimidazole carboxamide ribotide isomerase
MFRVYPAVDIKGGKCVRLYRGDMHKETVYSRHPWEMALAWERKGASYVHVVDLDGASGDSLINLESIRNILDRVSIPVQVGGGVRDEKAIETLLSMGARRVVLGTRAISERDFLEEMALKFGPRIIVSVDTMRGDIAVRGWTRKAECSLGDALRQLIDCGIKSVIHTDIERDGTLCGYNTAAIEPLLDQGIGIIAAGGISNLKDVESLRSLVARGVEGVIVGRALYEGELVLEDVLNMEEEGEA